MNVIDPELFEKNNVHKIYKNISSHFDSTRFESWPIIRKFINSFETNSLVGDIGCGNGRNSCIRNDCTFIATDIVKEFVDICNKRLGSWKRCRNFGAG